MYFGSESEVQKIKKYENLIVMKTFSKAWGLSGIRLGYMVANKKLSQYVSKCRTLVETNSLTYQTALWALKHKIFKEHVKFVKVIFALTSKDVKEFQLQYSPVKAVLALTSRAVN